LTKQKGILLIFDECTSAFRENFGGLHMKYGVYPDIATFGKALGNGYAISAIIGKKKYMKFADVTFMSSTFWTERIGPSAALKTLEVMERKKTWKTISKMGEYIKQKWKILSKKHKLPIQIFGLNSLCGFKILSKKSNLYKTLITQEMLKRGFLSNNLVYVCVEHSKKIVDKYFYNLDQVFHIISRCEKGENIKKYLKGPESLISFKRLN
jgi:glutamate-1-semialdehyde 2,1-aminomutase